MEEMQMKKSTTFICIVLSLTVFLGCRVPFSSQAQLPIPLTVMTYNIHVGKGIDLVVSLERIANIINESQPDLVGLQEVDRFTERSGRVDQLARLAQLTHMQSFYGKTISYQGGEYGIAILSRLPVHQELRRLYTPLPEREQRGLLGINVKCSAQDIWFITTHLGTMQGGEEQEQQVTELLDTCSRLRGHIIVCGDFNLTPDRKPIEQMSKQFADCWTISGSNNGYTFPANEPRRRIDYIFFQANQSLTCRNVLVHQSLASDHLAVIAKFLVGTRGG
jgi:endonuclease/exonuclease/phosphatase family metal-dependent hydrolase